MLHFRNHGFGFGLDFGLAPSVIKKPTNTCFPYGISNRQTEAGTEAVTSNMANVSHSDRPLWSYLEMRADRGQCCSSFIFVIFLFLMFFVFHSVDMFRRYINFYCDCWTGLVRMCRLWNATNLLNGLLVKIFLSWHGIGNLNVLMSWRH